MLLPNQLTVARIILTPFFFYFFLSPVDELKQLSLLIFVIAAITDWYDGWLARKFNYITAWGKFMDPLADKILTSAAFFGFVIIGTLDLWMVLLIVFRDITVTGLRGYADYKKVSFVTSKSAKWKTFLQMFFLYYLLLLYAANSVDWIRSNYSDLIITLSNYNLIFYSMLFITLFTLFTGITYIFTNIIVIKKLFKGRIE
ncbi:MAG: CDP-diacylglycerol--glycerol-3-phosphate 3-phosphatidyltransferase [Melioribacteraceae bacterium]